ncbi:MAG: hypothetical protein KBG17_08945 [Paludibacteraceae bacterium]|nr:hypothetical protein [Paludibacteraceae bacterium]
MKHNLFFRLFHFLFDKKQHNPILIVFVGDLVLETLHENYRKWTKKCEMCYIHTDMGQLQLYQQYEKLNCLYIGNVTKNHCGERDFESGRRYFLEAKEAIYKLICPEKYNKIVLVSTLRYSSACGISTELYVELSKRIDNLHFIGIKPLLFEGVKAINNFEDAMKVIDAEKLTLIDPNSMSKEMNFTTFITSKIVDLVNKQLKVK